MVINLVKSVGEKMKGFSAKRPSPITKTSWNEPGLRLKRLKHRLSKWKNMTSIWIGPCWMTNSTTGQKMSSAQVRYSFPTGGAAMIQPIHPVHSGGSFKGADAVPSASAVRRGGSIPAAISSRSRFRRVHGGWNSELLQQCCWRSDLLYQRCYQ